MLDCKIEESLTLAETLPSLLVDRTQIIQVLLNLFRNSIDAMKGPTPTPHVLGISTAPRGATAVEVVVQDTGGGIAPAIADRLFEPFQTTKPRGRWTVIVTLIAIGVGIAVAATRRAVPTTFHDPAEIEQILSLPVLGLITGDASTTANRPGRLEPKADWSRK